MTETSTPQPHLQPPLNCSQEPPALNRGQPGSRQRHWAVPCSEAGIPEAGDGRFLSLQGEPDSGLGNSCIFLQRTVVATWRVATRLACQADASKCCLDDIMPAKPKRKHSVCTPQKQCKPKNFQPGRRRPRPSTAVNPEDESQCLGTGAGSCVVPALSCCFQR